MLCFGERKVIDEMRTTDGDKDDCLREERNHKKGREEERGEMPLQIPGARDG